MPLNPGSSLGPYQVLAAIGAGGMGEVYRCRDAKLNRDVAIKVLPPAFAQDSERMARFQREAQTLAALNHPNIAHIHGFEESGGSLALVMELVEGQTLAGPKPLDEVVSIARQIAEALEYAHDKGIVHRDLKPANIKITSEGVVKVLDFGLAKAMEDTPAANADNSPTLSLAATKAGFILGTAAYMSPEQARGKMADRRSDIFSFGVVLLELITGKKTFEGEMITDVLAAVIRDQPAVPTALPPHIGKLLRRCLEKDPKRRLQAIGEARIMLDEAPEEALSSGAGLEVREPARWPVAWMAATAVLAIALAGAGVVAWRATRPAPLRPLQRFEVDLGAETLYLTRPGSDVSLSPDGTRLVTFGRGADGQPRLYTRLLDQAKSVPLSGTESAWDTFFSPDGQWLAFFSRSDSKLKKISVQGGAAVTLCDARSGFGGSWGEDGNIIAALDGTGLSRVPSAGGAPQAVTQLDKASQEVSQRFPQVLPGAQAVLFTSHTATSNFDEATIAIQDLKTGRRTTLMRGGYYGRYVPSGPGSGSGHLLYVHQATLFAAPMSLARLELTGPAAPVLEGVRNYNGGGADISFSLNGTLAFMGGGTSGGPQRTMLWLDRTGKTEPIRAVANYFNPRLAPDGKRLAIVIGTAGNSDVYSYEWTRDTMQRLTFTPGINAQPAWAPDGKHFAFISNRGGGPTNIYWMRADGAGEAQRLTESKNNQTFPTVAPDGKRLAFVEQGPEGRLEIWTLPLDVSAPDHPKPGKPEVFLRTAFNETAPSFSPDGRWLAYQSSESGSTQQVYVRSFPGPGGKWQVSGSEEGLSPVWLRNGREMIYRSRDARIMVAAYAGKGDAFVADKPRLWADKAFRTDVGLMFDATPDGKRIAVVALPDTGGQAVGSKVTFLLNFFDELQRKAPGKN